MHMSVIGNPLVVLAGMQDLNKVYKTGVLASSSLCNLLKERAHKFSFWPSKRIEVEQRDRLYLNFYCFGYMLYNTDLQIFMPDC